MRSIDIDWSEPETYTDVDMTCPFCGGEEKIDFELWKDEVLNRHNPRWKHNADIREELIIDYRQYRMLNEPEPLEFYDWLEEFWENIENESGVYEDSIRCSECESGYVHPMMNYAYPVCCDFSMENRRTALDCGLFLFEHPSNGDTYMSLTGGGMDLSPNILLAYLKLEGGIPLEWVMEFRQNYRAYISEEDHMKIAIACRTTITNWITDMEHKKKALDLFIDHPDEMKRKLNEREKEFNDSLEKLSDVDDSLIRGFGAIAAFCKATGDVV